MVPFNDKQLKNIQIIYHTLIMSKL